MSENLGLKNLMIAFRGEKPFTLTQIGQVFTTLEKIFLKFSDQIFESTDFCLLIDNFNNKLTFIELIASTKDNKPIKYSNFEELTMCVLYSLYSATFKDGFEAIDSRSISIHKNVFTLADIIDSNQYLELSSVIDNKLVKVCIHPDRKISLDKVEQLSKTLNFENKDDIIKAYESDKENSFVNCNLEEWDLSGLNLSSANFINSSLYKANLSASNLSNTNFSNSDVSKATLINANLSNSILEEADLSDANLTQADLNSVDLSYADLSNSKLLDAKLHDVIITETDLSGADLTNTVFSGTIKYNSETDFSNNANWWDAQIEDSNFKKWLEKHYQKQK